MVFKGTYLIPADRCGVWWVRVFHLYWGGLRKVSYCGEFVKVSVKSTRPKNKLRKKSKCVGVLVRLKKELFKLDRSFTKFCENNVVILKKRWSPRGKELLGPVIWTVRRRKFKNSFPGII